MRISRSLLLWIALVGWCRSGVFAQGPVSVAVFPDGSHPIEASFSGEMLLVTDTLRFRVESAVIRNDLGVGVVVASAILGLGQRLPDGSWDVVHRGYAFPIEVSAEGGTSIEVHELVLGLTRPGLLDLTELHPIVELVLRGPPGMEPSRSKLAESLGALFKLTGGLL